MYLVFKTDNWHTHASKDLIGICSGKEVVEEVVAECAKKENGKVSDDDWFNLFNINQTQGYEGEGEFVVEEVETDTYLG